MTAEATHFSTKGFMQSKEAFSCDGSNDLFCNIIFY
jgi:hypothetical protein